MFYNMSLWLLEMNFWLTTARPGGIPSQEISSTPCFLPWMKALGWKSWFTKSTTGIKQDRTLPSIGSVLDRVESIAWAQMNLSKLTSKNCFSLPHSLRRLSSCNSPACWRDVPLRASLWQKANANGKLSAPAPISCGSFDNQGDQSVCPAPCKSHKRMAWLVYFSGSVDAHWRKMLCKAGSFSTCSLHRISSQGTRSKIFPCLMVPQLIRESFAAVCWCVFVFPPVEIYGTWSASLVTRIYTNPWKL